MLDKADGVNSEVRVAAERSELVRIGHVKLVEDEMFPPGPAVSIVTTIAEEFDTGMGAKVTLIGAVAVLSVLLLETRGIKVEFAGGRETTVSVADARRVVPLVPILVPFTAITQITLESVLN